MAGASRRWTPELVVSHELPLAEAPHGYQIFERRADGAIKVLLHSGSHAA